MKRTRNKDFILKISILILFIDSMQPWLTWGLHKAVLISSGLLLLTIHWATNKSMYTFSKSNARSFLFILLGIIFFASGLNINGIIFYIPVTVILLIVVSLKEEVKIELIPFITKWVSRVIGISLCFYVLFLLKVPLPHRTIIHKLGYLPFDNYYLFIFDNHLAYPRFQSIFLEPGHMTMGLIPLIILNKFNIKNKNVIVLILAELFSLSLAGYITLLAGLILFILKEKKKYIIPLFLLLLLLVNLLIINNRDNIIYNSIGARLVLTDANKIAGYNRTTAYFDDYFDKIMNSSKKWFGSHDINAMDFGGGNQGIKVLIVKIGLIGAFFVYLTSISFGLRYKKYDVWCLIFIILVLISQNSYPFWFSVIFCVILGSPFLAAKPELTHEIASQISTKKEHGYGND